MAEELEGKGYLFKGRQLVAPVHYRLRSDRDEWGQSWASGDLRLASRQPAAGPGETFVMHTEEGFSVPLELTGGGSDQRLPFRRLTQRDVTHDRG